LVETYLPAWKSCVQDGGARSVMCSYNSVNGVPSCANDFLLKEVLRGEFGFDGYVVSDCDAINCIQNDHHYTDNPGDTCRVAVRAGTDLDCGSFYSNLPIAIKEGKLHSSDINQAVRRLFKQRMELGMFDPPELQPYTRLGPDVVDSPAHQKLALEAARQSMVLLKNEGNILPVSKKSRVAVIGPNGNVTVTLLSNYFGQRCHDGGYDCITTPYQAILKKGVSATFSKGCDIDSQNKSGFEKAISDAKSADVVFLFLGIDETIESEGKDRYTITLPGVQNELAQAIVATGIPTVVILINGNALAIEWIKQNVPGILEAYYAGEKASYAIADVLFGDYNPGGKLSYTIYPSEYFNQIPLTDMSMTHFPGRTYKYYTGKPLWPFGFGLSYTTFEITWIDNQNEFIIDTSKKFSVYFRANVTNTGLRAGDEVVLAFVNGTNSLKRLFGFQRVTLQPGESTQVFFAGSSETFSTVNSKGERIISAGKYHIFLTNGVDNTLTSVVTITGKPKTLFKLPNRQ